MRAAENLRTALKRLRHRPVRSFLLLQGTVWGIAGGHVYAAGRPLDPAAKARETVVEGLYAADLAPTPEGALGKELSLGNAGRARVVGVLAPRPERFRRANDQGFDTGHPVFKGV